ncbi:uncharacterized protein LOC114165565 [Vigna unguiculata]|uniref:uncharacterized protein LOC114165565 n=1 Tax=Vigna unguiculata TaxID=3917 RepID=UPI001015E1CE|nr:uncharacterized protein LOC114165565 [Vigna unguiculata]
MNDTEITKIASQLRILTLKGLSKLTHVWEKKKNGVLVFPNLQQVIVSNCKKLETLFPASLAKNFKSLKGIEIEDCAKFQEIVEKEESTEAKFVLPCLERLILSSLPQLSCFYPQTFTLECPTLNILSVLRCEGLELFQSQHSMGEGISVKRQPLISRLEDISNLRELKLDWKHILALRSRLRSEKFTGVFKLVNKMSLLLDGDVSEMLIMVNEILHRAPNLIEMVIHILNCKNSEIFFAQNPKIGEDGMLLQLRILTLFQVAAIRSIQSENSSCGFGGERCALTKLVASVVEERKVLVSGNRAE